MLLLPLALAGSVLADEDGRSIFDSNSQPLKAPKNSGGFVINLPNSYNPTKVDETTVSLQGETLINAYSRYINGCLTFAPVVTGVDIVNDGDPMTGEMLLTKDDGSCKAQVLLETDVFANGGVLEVRTWFQDPKHPTPYVPACTWYVIGSSVMQLDVPGILAMGQQGGFNHVEFVLYDLNALERARVRMELFGSSGHVHFIY
ncbi:MAG: hypothetical protein R3F30_11760 [Planctomycetota bacterium]